VSKRAAAQPQQVALPWLRRPSIPKRLCKSPELGQRRAKKTWPLTLFL
jgi:hypothetical protein